MNPSAPEPVTHTPSRLRIVAVLCAAFLAFLAAAPAEAVTVWVNQANGSCSDTGPGLGTPSKPYCTISAALAGHHAPGDSILVFPGIYREQVPNQGSGQPGNPIAVVGLGQPGNPVVVSGADDFSNPAQWTRFSGNVWQATVNWTPDQVFADSARLALVSGSPGSVPAGSFLWQSNRLYVNVGGDNPGNHYAEVGHRDYGFRISGSTQWFNIDGFAVTRCEDTGIFLNSNTSHISVTRDSVTYSFRYGIQSSGSSFSLIASCVSAYHVWSGIALTAGATGCTVQDNESFANLTPNQANGIYDFGAPNNLFQRNRLHDNAYNGIFCSTGATGNVMVQNRSWNNAHQGIEDIFCPGNTHIGDVSCGNGWNGFAIEGGATGTKVIDCIATDNNTSHLSGNANLEVDAQSTSGLVSNDNIFWNTAGGTVVYYGGTPYSTVSAYSSVSGQDTRTRQADPKFVNRAAGDFHLMSGSPAIDDANSSVANWPATDAVGNPRVDDPATANTGIGPVTYADRGALEYQPVAGPSTVYVNASSASCSDGGPGTQATPFCTISAALAAQHLPGSVIIVLPGIYREQVTLPASGVSGDPITLQAQGSPGNPVVVDGADDFANPALWTSYSGNTWLAASVTWNPNQVFADSARLSVSASAPASLPAGSFIWVPGQGLYVNVGGDNPGNHHAEVGRRAYGFGLPAVSWVVIDGFMTTRSESTGFSLAGSSQITVTNDVATFANDYGIQADSANTVVIGSCVTSNNLLSGIALTHGTTGCTVHDNESFANLAPTGNGIFGYGAPNNVIQRNRVHDNAWNGILMSAGSGGNVMIQNQSWNNAHQGFADTSSAGNTHVSEVSYGNGWNGFAIEGGATGTIVEDCIATDNSRTAGNADLEVDASSTPGLVSNDNVFWNAARGVAVVNYAGVAYTMVPAFSFATGLDTRTVQADPRFVNRTAGDFHLLVGSPAIDNANSSVANWPTTDAGGNARVDDPLTANTGIGTVAYGDRGAFEYLPVAVGPATVYVDASNASCSDGGSGSQTTPFCTISTALAVQHVPGSTIVVRPGIYREQVTVPASGVSGNPITLQAQGSPANPVVVDGADDFADLTLWTLYSGNTWLAASVTWNPDQVFADSVRLTPFTGSPASLPALNYVWVPGAGLYVNAGGGNPGGHHAEVGDRSFGFNLPGVSWIKIDGFTTTRSESTGVSLKNSSQITITNDVATYSGSYGIQADSCRTVLIGSCVTSNHLWSGIALTNTTTGCTVQDNESFGNLTPNQANGIYGFGAPNNLIQRNRLHDNAYNGIFMSTGSTGNVMLQNRSWNNAHQGIEDIFCPGNTHVGDVSYGNGWNGFAIEGGATGTTVIDCIATDNSRIPGNSDMKVDTSSTPGFVSNDNIFWNTAGGTVVQYAGAPYATVSAYSSATGLDTRTLQADPRFVNRAAGDFRLMGGSPAIDNANSSVANWPATDAAGNPRVDDPATANTGIGPVSYADRGALEYQPGLGPGTVYVNASSASCSDAGPGTLATPFCTISAALAAQHLPGSTIIVLPGIYREQVTLPASGLSGAPITLQAQVNPGNPVVVDGADDFANDTLWTPYSGNTWLAASVTWNPGQVFADSARLTPFTGTQDSLPTRSFVWISGAGLYVNAGGGNPGDHHAEVGHRLYGFNLPNVSWVVIDGFMTTRSESTGISIRNSSQITVTHDFATFANHHGIQADSCTAVVIGSCTSSSHLWSGIALTHGSTGCTVQDNESFGNLTPNGNGIYGCRAPNNVIQRNRVHDNAWNGMFMSTAASGNVVLQNRSWNNAHQGFADLSCTGNTHVGDVSYGNGWNGFAIEDGATGTTVEDCIATDNSRTGNNADLEVDAASTSGFVSNDNLFWNADGDLDLVQYAGTSYATVSAYSFATGLDTRTLQADPKFVNRAAGDFRLMSGSPAIDDANASVPNWPATDAVGNPRVDDPVTANTGIGPVSYADRGALEYQPVFESSVVYVNASSATCSDAGPGTQATPFCTISGALAAEHLPAATIIVLPGIYREQVTVPASGVSGAPITLQAQGSPGNPVVISGADDFSNAALWTLYSGNVWLAPGVTWNPSQVFADSARLTAFTGTPASLPARSFMWVSGTGLYVNAGGGNPASHQAEVGHRLYGFKVQNVSWIVIDGFTTTRSELSGIELKNSSRITVTNDVATYSGSYGIQADTCSAVVIDSCASSNHLWSGIALTGGSTGCTVQDNESFGNLTPNQANGIYGFGSPNNLIQRNRLHDNAYNGIFLSNGATGNVMVQNRSWNNAHQGIEDIFCPGNTHVGDVSYGNGWNGFAIEGGATGTTVVDCIATDNNTSRRFGNADLEVDAASTSGLVSNDNLFWDSATGDTVILYGGTAYTTVAAFSSATGLDTRTLQADPRFVNRAAGDFRLMAGSPAIDNANSSVTYWSATDAAGNARVDDPATPNTGIGPVTYADRGALEYQPAATPKTVYVKASSASCSDGGPGSQTTPFCTISAALAAHHVGGDSIVVYPGIYREQVNASGTGQPATPISIVGLGSAGSPVVISGADDFASPALWTLYSGNVWRSASVTWSPVQVFADSARLSASARDPISLAAGSFVWVSGQGLYVNVGGDNPGNHHAEVGHRLYGFRVGGTQWFNINGFAVTRCEDTGILLTSGTSHVSVSRDSVTYAAHYGIQSNGSSSALIASCVSSYNLWSGIALTAGATGCTVQDNESCRNLTAGTSAGIYLLGAPGNVVQRNRLHDNSYTGLHVQGSAGVVSLQNRSWNNGWDGFHDVGSTGVTHIGDVAFGNYRDGFGFDNGTTGATLGNCIATVNGLIGLGYDLLVDSVAVSGLVSDDNLIWNPSGRVPVRYAGTNYGTVTAYSAATGHDTRTIQADPRFADPWNGDLRLTSGSPAIDNANSSLPLWPATDALGAARIDDPSTPNAGLGPMPYADRGALEYVPTSALPNGGVPHFDHVIVVVMENQSYAVAKAAPTIASMVASGASFAHFYSIVHPSQPNYFALWSGDTQGIVDDSCPPPGSPFDSENLGHACAARGLSWHSYSENLPEPGSTVCDQDSTDAGFLYSRKHAPWVSFSNVDPAYEMPYTQLAQDIASNALPNLAFVTPNNCHNGHDCPLDSADAWLSHEMPQMLSAVGPNGLVVLTWDEDNDSSGNQILTVLQGPLVKPGVVSQRFANLYTLLNTICVGLNLDPMGAAAAERPITDVWINATAAVGPPLARGAISVGAWRPNPFHTVARIALTLPRPTVVAAEIYDLAGRRVWTMGPVSMTGPAEIRWDGTGPRGRVAPGVYLMRVRAGDKAFTRRVVRLE